MYFNKQRFAHTKTRAAFIAVLIGLLSLFVIAGCTQQQSPAASSATAAASTEATSADAQSESAEAAEDVQFVLYVGTNDKDTNEPVYPKDECKQKAKDILIKSFGGYTIQDAEGGWVGDDGTECQEHTNAGHR